MSQLSTAIEELSPAASDLAQVAATLKAITRAGQTDVLPATTDLLRESKAGVGQASEIITAIEEKVTALLGRFGALAEKATTIAVDVRDGAWIELKDIGFGGELRFEGRLRICKPDRGEKQ